MGVVVGRSKVGSTEDKRLDGSDKVGKTRPFYGKRTLRVEVRLGTVERPEVGFESRNFDPNCDGDRSKSD